MALGTITVSADPVKAASAILGCAQLSFAGDGSYPTGGTAGFQATVRTAIKKNITILAVVAIAKNGGYDAIYDVANDKLLCKAGGTEVAPGDLSGTTFKLAVIYQ